MVLVPADLPLSSSGWVGPCLCWRCTFSISNTTLCGSLLLVSLEQGTSLSFSLVGTPNGISSLYLLRWSHVLTVLWWEPPPGGLFWVMAVSGPSRFHSHTPFTWQPLWVQTFSGGETDGETCQVPTWGFHPEIDWHQVFSLPL